MQKYSYLIEVFYMLSHHNLIGIFVVDQHRVLHQLRSGRIRTHTFILMVYKQKSERCGMDLHWGHFTLLLLNKIQCFQLPLDSCVLFNLSINSSVWCVRQYYWTKSIVIRLDQGIYCYSGTATAEMLSSDDVTTCWQDIYYLCTKQCCPL